MIKFEQPQILLGFFYAFIGTALFSLKSIFIKLAYEQGLETNSVLMLRMAISLPIYLAILVYLISRKDMPKEAIKQNALWIVFLGFIGYFLSSWLDLKGLEYISAGLERLTLFTYPIFTALLGALFFKIPIDKKLLLTLVLTYLGLWIIFKQEAIHDNHDTLIGVILVLLAALSFSLYVLIGKKMIDAIGSLWFTSLAMCISSVFVLVYYALFFHWSVLIISSWAWVYIICLALISTVIPSFMISEAIAKVGSAKTGIIGMAGPILTILLAVIILDEMFTFDHMIGTILVILGIMLLTVKLRPL